MHGKGHFKTSVVDERCELLVGTLCFMPYGGGDESIHSHFLQRG